MKTESAVYEASFGRADQLLPPSLPEIVFSGRSNVGKSSLLNCLLNRKSLARVSATPGKTITINFYRLDTLRLVDLPGYGYAKRPESERKRWSKLVEGYFDANRPVSLVLQLIDMRHPASADDLNMLHYLKESMLPFVIILTKADKLNRLQRTQRLAAFEDEFLFLGDQKKVIPFSASSGEGLKEIRSAIHIAESGKEDKHVCNKQSECE